jgi:small conductance mechanosensitive channel
MSHFIRIAALVCFSAISFCAAAQDASEALPAETAAQFDELRAEITGQKEGIARLEIRAARNEGVMADLLAVRRDRLWTLMFRNTVALARQVAEQRSVGRDVSAYWDPLTDELSILPGEVQGALQRLEDRVVFATRELETKQFVIADQEFFQEVEEQGSLFHSMVDYVEIAGDFGLDATSEREFIVAKIQDNAANISVFLTMAQNDVGTLRAAAATLPNDTDIADWLSAADTRIHLTAGAMQEAVSLMDRLGLGSQFYRQQLLTATGEITADVLDVGIVASLAAEWSRVAVDVAASQGPGLLFRGLFVLLILFIFWQFAKLVQMLTKKALSSSHVKISNLLRSMIQSTVRNIVFFIGLLIAISQIGISLGPLLAGLGIVGFIIGFALQGTLSNFASGVMILLYRPFDVGDVVEAGGVLGKVNHMSLVNTTFMTLDNQRLIVPNNLVWEGVITNITAQRVRRIDLMFGIAYGDDIGKVEKILTDIVVAHEAVLDSPEPVVKLHELAESSVNFVVRPWVKTDDYWETYWDITKAVKLRFDEEGISIPFPQRDVHVIEQQPN